MAKKDIGEMTRAAGFQNQFWLDFVAAVAKLGGSAEQLFAANNDQLRAAAQAAAQSIVQSSTIQTIDSLVAMAKDAKNPYRLTNVDPSVTEANFGTSRPLRSKPIITTLLELGMINRSSCEQAVMLLDEACARPTMAEALSYAIDGWDKESSIWFILDSGDIGFLAHNGWDRALGFDGTTSDFVGDWGPSNRFLVFRK